MEQYETIPEPETQKEAQDGNDFDDFGEMASEKMGDSMISNKSDEVYS